MGSESDTIDKSGSIDGEGSSLVNQVNVGDGGETEESENDIVGETEIINDKDTSSSGESLGAMDKFCLQQIILVSFFSPWALHLSLVHLCADTAPGSKNM